MSVLAAQEVRNVDGVRLGRVGAIGKNIGTLGAADIGQSVSETMRHEKG